MVIDMDDDVDGGQWTVMLMMVDVDISSCGLVCHNR